MRDIESVPTGSRGSPIAHRLAWLALFAAVTSSPARVGAATADAESKPSLGEASAVSATELSEAIRDLRLRVAEFLFLREWGKKNGVRVFAAGGTAAGLAHVVKAELIHRKLIAQSQPSPYFESRFGYDYYDLYRSTQDADIVIDAPGKNQAEHEELAEALEEAVRTKFPHAQGSKSAWEVRLLRFGRGDDPALPGYKHPLFSEEFQYQHTDSHSTGLIELTDPSRGESVVRDLKDWESRPCQFLRDAAKGQLHYYFSERHQETQRARDGINPPILSVIRALTKAFQYGLDIRQADWDRLKATVDDWDSTRREHNAYNIKQVASNGLKLFWHAQDVEIAWNALEEIGLRKKLIEFGEVNRRSDLSIWLDREPLKTRPVGDCDGKTAADLGIHEVARETSDILAYEAITRSIKGRPNVFISREGAPNEAAVGGNGFYTRRGREGARGTGMTIRFKVDPRACMERDFLKIIGGDHVIFTNKAVLTVVDESLELTPLEYLRLVKSQKVDQSDLGVFEMARRKIHAKLGSSSEKDQKAIHALLSRLVTDVLGDPNLVQDPGVIAQLKFYATTSLRARHPKLIERLFRGSPLTKTIGYPFYSDFLIKLLGDREVAQDPRWTRWLVRNFLADGAFGRLSTQSRAAVIELFSMPWMDDVLLTKPAAERDQISKALVNLIKDPGPEKLFQENMLAGKWLDLKASAGARRLTKLSMRTDPLVRMPGHVDPLRPQAVLQRLSIQWHAGMKTAVEAWVAEWLRQLPALIQTSEGYSHKNAIFDLFELFPAEAFTAGSRMGRALIRFNKDFLERVERTRNSAFRSYGPTPSYYQGISTDRDDLMDFENNWALAWLGCPLSVEDPQAILTMTRLLDVDDLPEVLSLPHWTEALGNPARVVWKKNPGARQQIQTKLQELFARKSLPRPELKWFSEVPKRRQAWAEKEFQALNQFPGNYTDRIDKRVERAIEAGLPLIYPELVQYWLGKGMHAPVIRLSRHVSRNIAWWIMPVLEGPREAIEVQEINLRGHREASEFSPFDPASAFNPEILRDPRIVAQFFEGFLLLPSKLRQRYANVIFYPLFTKFEHEKFTVERKLPRNYFLLLERLARENLGLVVDGSAFGDHAAWLKYPQARRLLKTWLQAGMIPEGRVEWVRSWLKMGASSSPAVGKKRDCVDLWAASGGAGS